MDYHIAIVRHYYSVPHHLVKNELRARITARTSGNGQHSTHRDHMPAQAPGAGMPHLPVRDPAGRQDLPGPPRRRLQAGARDQCPFLFAGPFNPEEWAGAQAPHPCHGGACNHPPQHPPPPKGRLLLMACLRRDAPAAFIERIFMLTHPTLDRLNALRLDGMAEAFAEGTAPPI
ncbi:hypothetical protein [Leisingera sp. NJS204]|uniref:hypothetical protein n=1 Tax=Leisingera sp. NJS204 TaxID=2508307 RepID=UPI003F8D6C45